MSHWLTLQFASSAIQMCVLVACTFTGMFIVFCTNDVLSGIQLQEESNGSVFTVDSLDAYCGVLTCPFTILHPLHGLTDPMSLMRTLYQLQPGFVVLYDTDVTFIRQLEVSFMPFHFTFIQVTCRNRRRRW